MFSLRLPTLTRKPIIAQAEIVEDLRSALTQFEGIAEELGEEE